MRSAAVTGSFRDIGYSGCCNAEEKISQHTFIDVCIKVYRVSLGVYKYSFNCQIFSILWRTTIKRTQKSWKFISKSNSSVK